jgi:hypothetical protein
MLREVELVDILPHSYLVEILLGDLYVLKNTLNYPQLNCQPGVSKLRVVEKYMPKVKGW